MELTMPSLFCDMPLGRFCLEEMCGALTRIQWLGSGCVGAGAGERPYADGPSPLLHEAERQLRGYFSGRLRSFDLPLSPQGTDFQKSVWSALCSIGWGELRAYGDIARAVGSPKAFRAVGMACHCNPLMVVVPCHRVIGAGGWLTGYAGGLELKRSLLELEGWAVRESGRGGSGRHDGCLRVAV
jgi:methylated-DNA-[protein]-cysteine S-methyltransferase